MGLAGKVGRRIWSATYRRHIGLEFPIDMVVRERDALPPLDPAYIVRKPPRPADAEAVATLLNREAGFGSWTAERVKHELFERMAHPSAGTLILSEGTPVATGFATDESRGGTRLVHGMFLYVAPEHRRRSGLGAFILFDTFGGCVDAGYDRVLAFTDATRLPALLLYLSKGAKPVYLSLSCYWRWRKNLPAAGAGAARGQKPRQGCAAPAYG